MDNESKKLLEETARITQENNEILHSMRRSMKIARIMSFIYWVFILGSAIGAYYFFQPYLDGVVKIYGSASSAFKNFK